MAKGVSIRVEGLAALQKKFGKLSEEVVKEVDMKIGAAAVNFEDRAAIAAPVDNSLLKQGIKAGRLAMMKWEVTSAAPYSAYIEFGTIERVSVPQELQAYAIQFKGKGIRKTGGIHPQPFFFIQRGPVMDALRKDLKGVVKKAMK